MDGQAREGEKSGGNLSQCRKKGKSSRKMALSCTPRRDLIWGAQAASLLISAASRNELPKHTLSSN